MPTSKPRISVTIDQKTYEKTQYWADKKHMSLSEYVVEAITKQIQHETSDFDVPNLAIQRINQNTEALEVLASDVGNLQESVLKALNQLIGLTRGDNYLLSEDDGELNE